MQELLTVVAARLLDPRAEQAASHDDFEARPHRRLRRLADDGAVGEARYGVAAGQSGGGPQGSEPVAHAIQGGAVPLDSCAQGAVAAIDEVRGPLPGSSKVRLPAPQRARFRGELSPPLR